MRTYGSSSRVSKNLKVKRATIDAPRKATLTSDVDALWNTAGEDASTGATSDLPMAERLRAKPRFSEFDVERLLDEIYDPNYKVMRDLRVDDRDLAEFPNFWDFTTSPNGLNASLFSRQLYVCLMLFHEICPVCSNPKYIKHIEDVPLKMKAKDFPEHFQLLEYGVCPKCKRTKNDLFSERLLNPYQELAGLAGQRVGKSLITAGAGAYLTHKMLKMQNPSQVYRVLNTTFVGTFVGLTYDAAYQQLWLPYKGFIEGSKWFNDYHDMLRFYGEQSGQELFTMGVTGLHYHHRGVLTYPSGPNKKTLRGKTRFFGAVDEMDFFNNDDEEGKDQVKMNGVEVYKSLNNSLLTVRAAWRRLVKGGNYNVPNAYQLNVSSPQSARGVLTETVARNQESRKVYCFHLATWEMNPNITRADLAQEFADNPEKAERDFGANPPVTDSPFMTDTNAVHDAFGKRPNAVTVEFEHVKTAMGATRRFGRIVGVRKPGVMPPTILSLDAGYSNNSFAATIVHREYRAADDKRFKMRLLAAAEVIPEKNVCTLDYSKIIEHTVYPLIKEFNVCAVFADRWNSLKPLHDIEHEFKIPAAQYSLRYRDFIVLRSYIEGGSVILPATEIDRTKVDKLLKPELTQYPRMFAGRPIDHLFLQMCTVKDTDRDVIKGARLTDDIWRAMCLGMHWLLDDEFCETYLKGEVVTRSTGGLGAVAGGQFTIDPRVTNSVGALSSMMVGMSASSLYQMSAAGSKRTPYVPEKAPSEELD